MLYRCLRRSRYRLAASAEKATTPIALNSGTGMLFCSRYRFWLCPLCPAVTMTDQLCCAYPATVIVNWYVAGVTNVS